ncbi:MAG: glycogen synthase GlgA [Candidatus Omnitrophica bacterium]|nr:glycogen synthase GlgA [Candidatus Omnitrophota bacterium]
MKVLFCSSEVVPFAKTGGLADVAGTLPPALEQLDVELKVIMPKYSSIEDKKFSLKKINDDLYTGKIGGKVEVYFLEKKRYFDRPYLYQVNGADYPDNFERFNYFCLQTLRLMKIIGFKPDIIHCNDWQTALIPVYLKTLYKNDPFFKNVKAVFTVHNLGYQGLFSKINFDSLGLDAGLFSVDGLEFYGKVNLLKGGLLFSDAITTVSPTYAGEIQTREFGCGLEGVLLKRKSDIAGILNGIDYSEWDPRTNKSLAKNYGPENITDKYENKVDLQKLTGLPIDKKVPLLGIITRLADQKGLDILAKVIEDIARMPIQFVLLGTGEPKYHALFEQIKNKFKNTSINLNFNSVLAYKIYAGADIFLMPSYYEPCGLGQLISLSFATIPLVRKTGGLADTVIDYDPFSCKGNGFVFSQYEAGALLETLKRALCVYNNDKAWKKLMLQAMKGDFSWNKSAKEYLKLYKKLKAKK